MIKLNLKEVEKFAAKAREELWNESAALGREPKIYLHWTAGKYDTKFSDYHINITGDGSIYVSTTVFSKTLPHTWLRNTGSIGIALCACYGATSNDLGDYAPTAKQIEVMSQVIDRVATALWLTIDKEHVMTHGEAANNEDGIRPHPCYAWWNDEEGNGDTRGDLEYLGTSESPRYNPFATDGSRGGDVLRGKANWYKSKRSAK